MTTNNDTRHTHATPPGAAATTQRQQSCCVDWDAYLSGQLDAQSRRDVDERLAADPALRQELRQHKLLVAALQATGRAGDEDLGQAMAQLSEEQMRHIVGKPGAGKHDAATPARGRVVPLRTVRRWAAAAVVLVLIAAGGGYEWMCRHTEQRVCDTAFAVGFVPGNQVTRGEDSPQALSYAQAVTDLQHGRTHEAISRLQQLWSSKIGDPYVRTDAGTALVWAYVALHDAQQARALIPAVQAQAREALGEPLPELTALQRVLPAK